LKFESLASASCLQRSPGLAFQMLSGWDL